MKYTIGQMIAYFTLNESGEPVACRDMLLFARWFDCLANRMLKKDTIENKEVTTVFLGIVYGEPPLMWETAIDCQPVDRYATKAEALAGHERTCEECRLTRRIEFE